MYKETIGEKIQRLRREKNLTQGDIAEELNVSSQAVSKWENDIAYPDITLLLHLSKLLGVSVDYLLGEEKREVRYNPEKSKTNIDDLVLKIKVIDGKDKVSVNVPLALLKVFKDSREGMNNIKIGSSEISHENIDFDQLIKLAENGVLGKLVEIEGEDGETVEIYVE